MFIKKTKLKNIIIIEPKIYKDKRGEFCEIFRSDKLNKYLGHKIKFIQDNISVSKKGTLRGLHYQLEPMSQNKLISVVSGSIIDIVVDIRKISKNFGKVLFIRLDAILKKSLLIPNGFAHGFIALEDQTTVSYKVDKLYSKAHERSILFSSVKIPRKYEKLINKKFISRKDLESYPINFLNKYD
jgi:dTDP-4-dehydrorhamnose 3,5-epimerase